MLFLTPMAGYFNTVQVIFILQDPTYYNVPASQIGAVLGDVVFYSTLMQVFASLVIGYVYDIAGRRVTIFGAVALLGILVFLVQAPSPQVYPWLYIVKGAMSVVVIGIMAHPLIADYVEKDSRGRATGV